MKKLTPTEQSLAEIWQSLLGLDQVGRQVGREDDFYELGGNSLLAVHLQSRIRQNFGVEFALRQILKTPVLAHLAAQLESAIEAAAGSQ